MKDILWLQQCRKLNKRGDARKFDSVTLWNNILKGSLDENGCVKNEFTFMPSSMVTIKEDNRTINVEGWESFFS